MECTLCTNPIVSIPLEPPVKEKRSVSKKGGEMEKRQTSKSGKFYNRNVTMERSTFQYLKCSQSSSEL